MRSTARSHKYADWIARHPNAFFVSAYTSSSARGNEALQQYLLADRDIPVDTSLPPRLAGNVAFLRTSGANHDRLTSRAPGPTTRSATCWSACRGYARTPPAKRTEARRDPLR